MSATFGFGMLVYGLICITIAAIIIYFVIKNIK
jgi:hypothetical protein